MTTKQLMMTPPMKELYAFLDAYHVDDDGNVTDNFAAYNPRATSIEQGTAGLGGVTLAETLDPTSPNYMHWYDPDVATAVPGHPGCSHSIRSSTAPSSYALHYLLYGSLYDHDSAGHDALRRALADAAASQFSADDFTGWTMVTIRPPKAGETITRFYDLPALRTATELVLNAPRPGFFSTPAFFANWQTNTSNQMRVTINQALIVATGMAVDGTDTTAPPGTPGLDTAHAEPGRLLRLPQDARPDALDPLGTWTCSYYTQLDPAWIAQKGLFAFQGVVSPSTSIDDFAETLATHPALPAAWVQKLCYYANSSPCLHAIRSSSASSACSSIELLVERAGEGAVLVAPHHERAARP